jgi:two-component system KDP operon response regulator KdpE
VKVLVIDDEPPIRKLLRTGLSTQGYRIIDATNGRTALEALAREVPDLIILDLGLPDIPGHELLRRIRDKHERVPVVVLSSREDEKGKVEALDLGADDYVTKPFSSAELVSRIRSLMRRRAIDTSDDRRRRIIGGVALDLVRHSATVDGRPVALTPTEFRLVSLLSSDPERVFSREEIMRHLWQSAFVGDTRNVDVHVRNVRRKIEGDPAQPERLVTVRGVGYQLRPV